MQYGYQPVPRAANMSVLAADAAATNANEAADTADPGVGAAQGTQQPEPEQTEPEASNGDEDAPFDDEVDALGT